MHAGLICCIIMHILVKYVILKVFILNHILGESTFKDILNLPSADLENEHLKAQKKVVHNSFYTSKSQNLLNVVYTNVVHIHE